MRRTDGGLPKRPTALLADLVAVAAERRELLARLRTACLEEDRAAVLALARILTGIDTPDADDGDSLERTGRHRR